jgi:iduronate 2-sulfatase
MKTNSARMGEGPVQGGYRISSKAWKSASTAAALVLGGCSLQPVAPAPARPNILFIAVDDLRPELGCYGKDHIQSPNIDRIARSGMLFNRAYCQQAVCSPSRASLMTGARPDTTKVWDLTTHFRTAMPDVVTLGQHFKDHGYFVQGFGKIYHGDLDDAPTWSVPWQNPKAPLYALPENVALRNRKDASGVPLAGLNSRGPAFEKADVPDDTYADGQVAGMAVKALQDLGKKPGPFFLAVGFIRPHLPFVAPQKYWDLYDPAKIQLAPNPFRPQGAPEYAVPPGAEMRAYYGIPEGPIPPDLARQLKHGYYAATSYTDAQVGRLLDELDRLGLRKNTIIILWGDHGYKLGEHDAWCKHSNVEDDVRVPLLLSVPGMKNAGGRTDGLVEFVDIYPTLADLAGLPLPDHLEGTSFKPLLENPGRKWKPAAFSQYPRGKTGVMGYSMRTDRYRLTLWVDLKDPSIVRATELYDHETDPQENTNIAGDPAQAAVVEKLTAQLRLGWRGAKMAVTGSAGVK